MFKLKKVSTFLAGILLSVPLFIGCSNQSSQNKQDEVNTAFAAAIEKLKNTTHEHATDVLEASDPSIVRNNDTFKSMKWEYETNYEVKTNSDGKPTDDKITSEVLVKTTNTTDGKTTIKKTYIPGDGYKYVESGNEKYKTEDKLSFQSFEYNFPYFNVECIDSLNLTTNGSQQTFNFTIKKDYKYADWDCGSYVKWDSDVELVDYSGSLTVDDNSDTVKVVLNIGYKDKKTGATLKDTIISECDNSPHELTFPSDLSTYKEKA